ncbi:carbon-nitrogen hydrolase family protein [Labrys okinawensis]|uniref:carbon-nitrogen hydrolase family protein n=1 Tax=Labrys okinawensis TaxID=346911 RepID=UPI0039BD59F1
MATIQAAVLQFPVTMDIGANLAHLSTALAELPPETLAVVPEGALSGYLPTSDFVDAIDQAQSRRALETTRSLVTGKRLHLIVGACVPIDGGWRNASFYLGPEGRLERYDKINLAWSERARFTAGHDLPVFEMEVGGTSLRLGIQMCREIRYPEQWRVLAAKGAQVIAYVNNAIGSVTGHEVWRAHAISRAAETQRFVLGANNAAADQLCPSLIVAPSGKALAEAAIGEISTIRAELPLDDVSDWILGQAREDVVAVKFLGPQASLPAS